MKDPKKIIKTALTVTFAITVICSLITVILFVLEKLRKIDINMHHLTPVMITSLLFCALYCMKLAIGKCIDWKKKNSYEKKEKSIIADILDTKARIHDIRESIDAQSIEFREKVLLLQKDIESLGFSSSVLENFNACLFSNINVLCEEYLYSVKNLDLSLVWYTIELSSREFSGYGKYSSVKCLIEHRIAEINQKFDHEINQKYADMQKSYEKFYDEVIRHLPDDDLKNKLINLLNPEKYKFTKEMLELRREYINGIVKLAQLRQDLIDIQPISSKEGKEKVIDTLMQREQAGYQIQPLCSMSDTTIDTVSHLQEPKASYHTI